MRPVVDQNMAKICFQGLIPVFGVFFDATVHLYNSPSVGPLLFSNDEKSPIPCSDDEISQEKVEYN